MNAYNYNKSLIACYLFALLTSPIWGQEVKYVAEVQHFTVEDGLSHREVNTTFQDSHGFIWVGTNYGLNRFDGHQWLNFTKEKDGLSHNTINQIIEDDEGWLWIITFSQTGINTISFLHILTLEVQTFDKRFSANDIQLNKIFSVFGDKNKSIHISQRDKILNYKKGNWTTIIADGIGDFQIDDINNSCYA